MSAARKILIVFGATGQQGGSVAKSILSSPLASKEFHVRAITRDPSKPAAQELTKLGAECVAADLNDVPSIAKALDGAHSVFAVTNFWDPSSMSGTSELAQGKAIADAAKAAGVSHLVWSSLINVTELTGGKLNKVEHFDYKAKVEEYIREIGVPASFFLAGFYMSNLLGSGPRSMMRATGENQLTLALPMGPEAPLPLFDTTKDTGKIVKAILLGGKPEGKRVLGAIDYYTPAQIVESYGKVAGGKKAASFVRLEHDQFRSAMQGIGMSEAIAEEMLQNMRLMEEGGYYGGAGLEETKTLLVEGDKLTTWEEFVKNAEA